MMWASMLIYVLEIIIAQARGQENSTQMYYAKVTLDKSVLGNLTEILKPFVTNTSLHVDHFEKTTTCQNVSTGLNCTCEPGHRWSDKVCKSKKCCRDDNCTFPQNSPSMCIAENTVSVNGSITLREDQYFHCLTDKSSERFKKCNEKLLEQMKRVYSTLRKFDSLTISRYRAGSVMADFKMRIADSIEAGDLIAKTKRLGTNLTASLILETTGLVDLNLTSRPVCHDDQPVLTCTARKDFNTEPEWQLSRDHQVFDITNGTESEVTFQRLQSTVKIRNVSKIWRGVYTCVYTQRSYKDITISHKDSKEMDISLLPNIKITTSPTFPHCQKSSDILRVIVRCEIESSAESYVVTWKHRDPSAKLAPMPSTSSEEKEVYAATTTVSCKSSAPKPQITCIFRNKCNRNTSATTHINIISGQDKFCEAEGDWEVTKAGYTAALKCKYATGRRQRTCQNGTGTWDSEVSMCVNKDVDSVQQMANVVDSGRGSLQKNAAHVFSLLKVVTNDSQTIKTFSNLNASVQVLFTMSKKGKLQTNESAADDLLDSSSNLLEESLDESWEETPDEGNWSLAERYLSSVEQLIHTSNLTGAPKKKKNVEVAEQNCSAGSQCSNTVFNVTVGLEGDDPGSVKTAGFQQLENYLPNNNTDKFEPNSIVVSTTTERQQSDSVKVKINFRLLKPRPRNVELQCVAWDNKSRGWSPRGCKWVGPSHEAHCICRHLSSFAVLMSKYPLDVPWITEITYVGLSVSVVSLVVSLLIELIVWRAMIKTKSLQLRHTAHVNISLCLLVADCCFLASSKPHDLSTIWCKTLVVLKHFSYLSMFFWMLSLSCMLLHQTVFLFHSMSMKVYLRLSLVLGYVCPLLIVAITVVASQGGAEGKYFSRETCWLVYTGLMKGSIYTFVVPVGVIVFINVFSMLVVIMKLLDHPMNAETSYRKEKKAALTVMRSVVLLTPVFGLTWIFGFVVMFLDLTSGALVYAAHYIFTLLNAFQGLLILFTTSLGDKLTRQVFLNRLKKGVKGPSSEGCTTLESL